MDEPEVVGDGEEIRFLRDVELLRAGKPVSEVTEASYRADLAMADLLMRARFVPTAQFRAHLQNKLQSQSEIERRVPMLLVTSSLLRQLFKGALAVGLTAALVLATVLVLSPEARAQAQDLVVRFVEVDSPLALIPELAGVEAPSRPSDAEAPRDAPPMPALATGPGAAVGPLPTPEGISVPPLPERSAAARAETALISLEEAQAQIPFTIKLPATLPEGYSFKGVFRMFAPPKLDESLPREGAVPLPAHVTLIFENGAGETFRLSEANLAVLDLGDASPRPGAPAASGEMRLPVGVGSVQEVSVNGQPGQYVAGGWSPQGWDANAGRHQLQWRGADGLSYMLISQTLGLDDLLATAESIP